MSNRTQFPGWLAAAGLVMLALVATSCGDDDPNNPPTTGSIQASATTTGAELDADGYSVSVDGGAGQALSINGSVTFSNQTAGSHDVELSGVAANCTVTGDNPASVSVTAGSTATASFTITCSATTGDLEVTTVSTGSDIDTDGYTVSVDGGATQAITANGTLTVSSLDAGDHTVELGGVAANCSVGGMNPRTVGVTSGATAQTQFDVTCDPIAGPTGDLKVVNVTMGNSLDDAYSVNIDAAPTALPANDSVTVTALSAGDHTVELVDVASNCTVDGDNPRTVTVPDGGEVRTQFDVTCTGGSIDVTSNTWGLGLDTAYDLAVDGGTPQAIGANETVGFADLSVGDHTLELTGLASNCTVDGVNPQTVSVTDGATTPTTFDVFCFQTLSNEIVFETERDGNAEIYTRPPSQPPVNLTNNAADDRNPDVAPDGSAVTFNSNRGGTNQLWRMNDAGIRQLSTTTAQEVDPSYAGDLSGLAYTRKTSSTNWEIWKANLSLGAAQRLSSQLGNNDQPAYSPDGQWVLFHSDRDGNGEVYVVNVATGVETNLTNDASADGKPAWWYDGSKILWASDRSGDFEVYVADFDAITPSIGAATNLTNDPGADGWPDMRDNGASIAFATDREGTLEIYTMDPDGANQSRYAGSGIADDMNPSWSP